MKTRDMSKRQFLEALARHGMKYVGIMGYVEMFDGKLSVSMLNAGTKNRRARLAYLLREKAKYEAASVLPTKPKLQPDPWGRSCPDCLETLGEDIPLDSNGTCHGCGACYGREGKL